MRIEIVDRAGSGLYALQEEREQFSGLTFESIMPGGMSIASFSIPWRINIKRPRLVGCHLSIYDGATIVWWGTIGTVTDKTEGGDSSLAISAHGPWDAMAKIPFTQAYSGPTYTGSDIIKAALFGNVPDVAIAPEIWDSLAMGISPVTWTNSNVQTVITECLRFGDTTTSPWSFIILPPAYRPYNCSIFEINEPWNTIGTWSSAGTAPYVQSEVFQRGSAVSFWHDYNPAGEISYLYKAFASPTSDAYVSAWVRIPDDVQAVQYEIFDFYSTGPTATAILYITGAQVLTVWVSGGATTNGYAVPLGTGCWHHLKMYVHQHATDGIVQVQLDNGKFIIDTSSLNTGTSQIAGIAPGFTVACTTTGRGMDMDSLLAVASATDPGTYYRFDTETKAIPYLFKLDTSTYDIEVSLADLGKSCALSETIDNVANQVTTVYASGSRSYLHTDEVSIGRYGQRPLNVSMTKTSSSALANYYASRYLGQYKEPRYKLQPIVLAVPPVMQYGSPIALSRIRAGHRIRIRERPDLGNMYIAHTRWTQASMNQPEQVAITVNEPPMDVATLIALTTQRGWT